MKMVSTRGPKCKFNVNEKVLCYEPDPTKAKVLYDSKVREIIESKDKRGRKVMDYLIHFQGWNSSWDRRVSEDFVLKDTEENRQLQRDLAEKSQLQLGSYLYRKDRKKHGRRIGESSRPGMSDVKPRLRGSSEEGSSTSTMGPRDESEMVSTEEMDTESNSSSGESMEEERVGLVIGDKIKRVLERDMELVNRHRKWARLPADVPIANILELYVKYYSLKSIGNTIPDNVRRRNSHMKTEKKEKEMEKLLNNINVRKETADGLRIYFNFLSKGLMFYNAEKPLVNLIYAPACMCKAAYIPTEKITIDLVTMKNDGGEGPSSQVDGDIDNPSEELKRRLRSHRGDEELVLDIGSIKLEPPMLPTAVSSVITGNESETTRKPSLLSILKPLLPINIGASVLNLKDVINDILRWQILPNESTAEPCMIFGAIHLARLIVRMPEYLNTTSIPDHKMKVLLKHLNNVITFLEDHPEWFGEDQYGDASDVMRSIRDHFADQPETQQ